MFLIFQARTLRNEHVKLKFVYGCLEAQNFYSVLNTCDFDSRIERCENELANKTSKTTRLNYQKYIQQMQKFEAGVTDEPQNPSPTPTMPNSSSSLIIKKQLILKNEFFSIFILVIVIFIPDNACL